MRLHRTSAILWIISFVSMSILAGQLSGRRRAQAPQQLDGFLQGLATVMAEAQSDCLHPHENEKKLLDAAIAYVS